MNAIFICVIVLDKMCFHMLNLFWFKHKKIFECFRCFWKVLYFYKKWKISKTVLPCFGGSVVGHSSRMLQPWACIFVLATCSWVNGLVMRGTQRFSWLSLRLPRSRPSRHEKHLEFFFTIVTLSVLTAWPSDLLATCFSHEKRVFWVSKTVFKTFSIFPSTFCDCLLSSPFLSQLILTQTLRVTLYKLHFYTFSPSNLQEKGMGSHFLTSYLVFWTSFSWIFVLMFCFFFVFVFVFVMSLFRFLRLSMFGLLRYCSYVNLF